MRLRWLRRAPAGEMKNAQDFAWAVLHLHAALQCMLADTEHQPRLPVDRGATLFTELLL